MHRRDLLRVVGTSVAVGAAAFAGCTGGGTDGGSGRGGDGGTTTTDSTTESETTTTGIGGEATVRVAQTDAFGDVLVDASGLTLYRFEKDTGTESTCYDSCAQNWPPLTVDGDPTAGDGVTATLGTTTREDGARQVTGAGHPLYYFAGDQQSGDANGQGLADVWYVVSPSGEAINPDEEGKDEDAMSSTTEATSADATSATTTTPSGSGNY